MKIDGEFPRLRHVSAFLALLLLALFSRSLLDSDALLFSSDAPYGLAKWVHNEGLGALTGLWQNTNWVGGPGGSESISLTTLTLLVLNPILWAKLYAPICLFCLGMAAWFAFKSLEFNPFVCAAGAVAAVLNANFVSYACWGLGTVVLSGAWMFVAVGALGSGTPKRGWILAGFAIGMSVVEGFDCGAIYSIVFACFVFYCVLAIIPAPFTFSSIVGAAASVVPVALVAGLVAMQTVSVLVNTQIKGVAGMAQDTQTKEARWEEATRWSLPKVEASRILVSGLFGYRMDSPDGHEYWGRVGEAPGHPGSRHSGSDVYGGAFVVMVTITGLIKSCRRKYHDVYSPTTRKIMWFWFGVAVVSLLLSFGKYTPLYRVLYDNVPYFSTFRNPVVKFMQPFHVALIFLFTFGLEGLWHARLRQSYLSIRWGLPLAACVISGLGAVMIYHLFRPDLLKHLYTFMPANLAEDTAVFSGLCLTAGAFTILMSAVFVDFLTRIDTKRWLFCAIFPLCVDGLSNYFWVTYEDHQQHYAANPIVDVLRSSTNNQRVAIMPPGVDSAILKAVANDASLGETAHDMILAEDYLRQTYHTSWLQHAFRYYNIQSLDVVQEPRPLIENLTYRDAFNKMPAGFLRLWELTSTRYLLGLGGPLAEHINPRIKPLVQFSLTPTSDSRMLAKTNSTGPCALYEFTGAMQKATLFTQWKVLDDELALRELTNPSFNPESEVILSSSPTITPSTNAVSLVTWLSSTPKQTILHVSTDKDAILMVNDKYDKNVKVSINGNPATLLRCNYLMRGVQIPAGSYVVDFFYEVERWPLVVSLYSVFAILSYAVLLPLWRRFKQS